MTKIAINALLLDGILRHKRPDMLWHKVDGQWEKIASEAFLRRVAAVGHWLKEQGIKAGDRVATFSNNRPEWHMADLGVLGINAIHVPLYFAESPERLQFILSDSGARICFVSGAAQWRKVKKVWGELPALEKVVTFSPEATEAPEAEDGRLIPWATVADETAGQAALQQFVRRARSVDPDSVATLIYTSGTTGRPKGVLLTQSNLGTNARDSFHDFDIKPDDLGMCLLPLCHIYERTVANANLASGVRIAYAESFDKILENLNEVHPTLMAVVPRFFEKSYSRLNAILEEMSPLRRAIFNWALAVGKEYMPFKLEEKPAPLWLRIRVGIADRLVYRKIHQRLGGRLRAYNSGGAPLSKSLNEFFNCLGFNIYEGYGLTETSPVITTNLLGPPVKPGTVGPMIPGVEVRIADDGEILTRGLNIMKGYYGLEEETARALEGGWFHTGDIGMLDEDNYLIITDRKKDVIKTAAGKMIAPQPIENELKQSPYIQNAVVVGDRRKFPSALLVPDFGVLEEYARKQGWGFESAEDLFRSELVYKLLEDEVEKVNRHLAQFEKIKKFALLELDFTFDAGQLTYTQKVRRNVIEKHYAAIIDGLYDEPAEPVAG
jgi:long-chain acyl-CoA synthetase